MKLCGPREVMALPTLGRTKAYPPGSPRWLRQQALLETEPQEPRAWFDWMTRRHCGAASLCNSQLYFIQCNGGPIKIGMARNVKKRMADFRISNPFPLVCLLSIRAPYDAERILHERFAEHRIHGEWFSPARALLEFIDRCSQ